jgi:hypothetical protein
MKVVLLVVSVLFAMVRVADAQEQPKERKCLGLNGKVSYGAIGSMSGNRGVRGDLILLGCEGEAGKKMHVGAYLYYRETKKQGLEYVGVGEWKGVPVARNAQAYRSASFNCAGQSANWRHSENGKELTTVQLFIPYEVLALQRGTYEVIYRVTAWSDDKVVDDFYTNTNRMVNSTGSTWYENMYACYAPSGPVLCDFRLIGTTDAPDQPNENNNER